MPRSDNLYSADSDTESFTNELSPTDGYFTRGMPADVLVLDPTPDLDRKTTEDKVLIPAPGRGLGRAAPSNASASSRNTRSANSLAQLYPSHATHASPRPADDTPLPTPIAMYDPSAPISPLRNTTPFSPRINTPSSPRSPRQSVATHSSEHTPLMGAPPPAYSASPIDSPGQPLQHTRSYHTFEQNRSEQHSQAQRPESMGRPEHAREERIPLFKAPPNKDSFYGLCRFITREIIRKLLFAALVIVVFVTILLSTLNIRLSSGDRHQVPNIPPPGSHAAYCVWAKHVTPMDPLPFSVGSNKDLTIKQTTYNEDPNNPAYDTYISPDGEIIVRRLPKDSNEGPHFTFDVRASDPTLVVLQTWDEQLRTLIISTPQSSHLKLPGPHCISLEITAWLPENAELNNLAVQSTSLVLRVLDDVKINVFGGAGFSSTSGAVHFPEFSKSKPTYEKPDYSFESRRIIIETSSGSINGLYPLYDLLSLQSQSGTVHIGVIPQKIDPAQPATADLKIKTTSGSIYCRLPILFIGEQEYTPPIRDYVTHVESNSGTLSGTYYQGSHGYFYSTSGSIQGSILPVIGLDHGSVNNLETTTTSGTTSLDILSPILYIPESFHSKDPKNSPYIPINDDDPYLLLPPKTEGKLHTKSNSLPTDDPTLQTFTSTHQSTSGKISVRYPVQWEGIVDAVTMTGSIAVNGKDLHVIRSSGSWAKKQIVAQKGYQQEGEASRATLTSISGSLNFSI